MPCTSDKPLWRGTYLGVSVTVRAEDEHEAKELTFKKVMEQYSNGNKKSTDGSKHIR